LLEEEGWLLRCFHLIMPAKQSSGMCRLSALHDHEQWKRERERERERETDRQTDRQTDTHTHTHTERERERERESGASKREGERASSNNRLIE